MTNVNLMMFGASALGRVRNAGSPHPRTDPGVRSYHAVGVTLASGDDAEARHRVLRDAHKVIHLLGCRAGRWIQVMAQGEVSNRTEHCTDNYLTPGAGRAQRFPVRPVAIGNVPHYIIIFCEAHILTIWVVKSLRLLCAA
jgi:hypothetical protein